MQLTEIVAARIKALRAKRKLTQQELADACELSVSYISMLERGERSPPLDTLEALATAFGVKALELLKA
jgi:transcriptional regulator with XRE-family HTH domain